MPKKIKSNGYKITRIIFEHDNRNIIIDTDCNFSSNYREITYKDVIQICNVNNIEFKNQTFASIVKELRNIHYNKNSIRIKFNKEKRE